MLTKNVYLDEQFCLTFLFGTAISHWKWSRGFEILEKNGHFLSFFSKPCLFSYDLYSFLFEMKSIMSRWLFTIKKDVLFFNKTGKSSSVYFSTFFSPRNRYEKIFTMEKSACELKIFGCRYSLCTRNNKL